MQIKRESVKLSSASPSTIHISLYLWYAICAIYIILQVLFSESVHACVHIKHKSAGNISITSSYIYTQKTAHNTCPSIRRSAIIRRRAPPHRFPLLFIFMFSSSSVQYIFSILCVSVCVCIFFSFRITRYSLYEEMVMMMMRIYKTYDAALLLLCFYLYCFIVINAIYIYVYMLHTKRTIYMRSKTGKRCIRDVE